VFVAAKEEEYSKGLALGAVLGIVVGKYVAIKSKLNYLISLIMLRMIILIAWVNFIFFVCNICPLNICLK